MRGNDYVREDFYPTKTLFLRGPRIRLSSTFLTINLDLIPDSDFPYYFYLILSNNRVFYRGYALLKKLPSPGFKRVNLI